MGLERFVRVNLVLVPLLLAASYLFQESLPFLVVPFGVAYVTFSVLIVLAYGLSKASMAIRSDDSSD